MYWVALNRTNCGVSVGFVSFLANVFILVQMLLLVSGGEGLPNVQTQKQKSGRELTAHHVAVNSALPVAEWDMPLGRASLKDILVLPPPYLVQ